jgi:hypothetical protein
MTTNKKRVELYRRLPEIYRIKDESLPELYLHGGERVAAYQLRSYLEPVEDMFSAIHENIESLYHDLFIETCDDWVTPYIGDLLGTTHLAGDEWTLRADVADTIALRRRKGTLGAIELLAFIHTKWGVHCVELLENMVWNQHLNHQRLDEGGTPPYSLPTVLRSTPIRGGTVTLRDPSALAQLNTPFDPFAHVADVQPHEIGQVRYNLPNLAIYLWRLRAFRLNVTKPHMRKFTPVVHPLETTDHPQAARVVRINVDPVPLNDLSNPYVKAPPPAAVKDNRPGGRPVTLFNTNRYELFTKSDETENGLNLAATAPRVSTADQVPGPIPMSRVSDLDIADAYDDSLASPTPQPFEAFAAASFTAPQEYVAVETYLVTPPLPPTKNPDPLDILDVGLQLHLPNPPFAGQTWLHRVDTPLNKKWIIRGENLCAWERGINPPLDDRHIAIDPERGRICIGLGTLSNPATHAKADSDADALVDDLLLTFTYGSVGEVGAHPISYQKLPKEFDHDQTPTVVYKQVEKLTGPNNLQKTLDAAITAGNYPIVIEITNSLVHKLDIGALASAVDEGGLKSLPLDGPLIIRSADGQRPIVELKQPLAFRPKNVVAIPANAAKQKQFDAVMDAMFVRLEGLYIARSEDFASTLPAAQRRFLPLIARAALNKLEILNCTLDPGGFQYHNGTRAPLLPGIRLKDDYGFGAPNPIAANEEKAFKQKPDIIIQRSVTGACFTDEGYRLCITDSIIESIPVSVPLNGGGTRVDRFAITGATDAIKGYAGEAVIQNVTILGRTRVYSAEGSGGIFRDVLEAFDQQVGCLKYCYFADDSASLPPPDEVKNRLPQNFKCVSGKDARLIFTSEFFSNAAYCQLSLECDPRILEEGVGNDQMGAFNFLREAHKWRNLQIRFREFMPVGIRPLLIPVT